MLHHLWHSMSSHDSIPSSRIIYFRQSGQNRNLIRQRTKETFSLFNYFESDSFCLSIVHYSFVCDVWWDETSRPKVRSQFELCCDVLWLVLNTEQGNDLISILKLHKYQKGNAFSSYRSIGYEVKRPVPLLALIF